MAAQTPTASRHYMGSRGQQYYRAKFGADMQRGRLLQLRHFQSFCSPELDLLDFGCSDGLAIRTLPARRRYGVEVNETAVAACRAQAAAARIDVEIFARLDQVPSNSVDVVISNHCLEHVPQPLEALRQIRRILRAEGRCILVTPFDDWRNSQYRQWKADDRDHHLYTWSPMNLGNLVTEAGLICRHAAVVHKAWSKRLLATQPLLGRRLFELLCWGTAVLRNRREVFCYAEKNE